MLTEEQIKKIINILDRIDIFKDSKVLSIRYDDIDVDPIMSKYTNKKINSLDLNKNNKPKYEYINYINDDFNNVNDKYDYLVFYNSYQYFDDMNTFVLKCFELLKEAGRVAIIFTNSKDNVNKEFFKSVKQLKKISEEFEYFKYYFNLQSGFEDNEKYILIMSKQSSEDYYE